MKIGLCIKYFQVFFKKPQKTYNTRMFESNWKYVTTMVKVFLKVANTHLYIIQKEINQEISYHMIPNVISHQKIIKHMGTHVITPRIIKKEIKHMGTHVITPRIIKK